MYKNYKTLLLVIAFILLIIFIIINQFRITERNNGLKRNGVLSNAIILGGELRPKRGNTLGVKYNFFFNGLLYKSESNVMGIFYLDFNSEFAGKSFPVIHLPNNPVKNEILVTPDKFERYGLPFPDSLSWVRKFWKKDYIRFD